MATPNRWAIRDAGIATFFDLETGKPIVTLETLKTTGVSTSGETVYARGGRGNAKLVGFSSNRESTLTLEDAIFDNEAVAMLTGNNLATGVKTIDFNEKKSTQSDKIVLSKTPKNNVLTSVFKLNADGTNGDEYTLGAPATAGGGDNKEYSYDTATKTLTVSADVTDGTSFRIYYKVETATDAKTIKVTSDAFGGSFRIAMEVLVIDEFTKKAYQGMLNIPNGKFMDNFEMSFSADGDPASLNLEVEVLKSPTSTDMWELVVYSEDDIV